VVYVGIAGGRKLWRELCPWLCAEAGVAPLLDAPKGVEVTERRDGDRRVLFLLNHGDRPRTVRLGSLAAVDLADETRRVGRRVVVEPRGLRVLGAPAACYRRTTSL